ncbi:MAG: AI-2E family transporter [Enterococcus sp.]
MFWSLELLIVATLIFVATKINFLFQPVGTFFSTLFAPVLIAGFLYYILNPIVRLLMKYTNMKRIYAIIIVLLLLLGVFFWTIVSVIPSLVGQLSSLAASIPDFANNVEQWARNLAKQPIFDNINIVKELEKLDLSYSSIIQQFISGVSTSLSSILGTIASTTVILITAPFILFYMLKDGERLVPTIEKFFPEKRRHHIVALLEKLNTTLSSYISGQVIECLFVATCTCLGYLIIGVDYAFLFGVIAGITNLIPYLGPYIGLAPAFLATIFNDPFKALLCCVVVLVVQQIDSNIIYPNVIGKSLDIHPLTIILVLLVAGNIAGLLGIFLGVPFYAVCRTIVVFVVQAVRKDQRQQVQEQIVETNEASEQ